MLRELLSGLTAADGIALALFLLAWFGYSWYADHSRAAARGLIGVSHDYRVLWARRLLERDMRVADAALVGNLMNSVSFYANTTIYIIAGLVAVIGALDQVISATADLPFARAASREVWELKLLLLLGIFVVAYFKLTWSIRQFNFLSILIGAAPAPQAPEEERTCFAQRMAAVNSLAGDEFNRGIRAYYFGLAAVTWIVQPWLFLLVTMVVVVVLYRRDYSSPVLRIMADDRVD